MRKLSNETTDSTKPQKKREIKDGKLRSKEHRLRKKEYIASLEDKVKALELKVYDMQNEIDKKKEKRK